MKNTLAKTNDVPDSKAGHFSRRRFLSATGVATAAVWLNLRSLFADDTSPVIIIRQAAATAKINVQKLRGNVSVLEGSGGNIAVLTGRDGKLLVDAGITASRPRITEALASLSADPVKHLINSHWHFDHTDGNEWLHSVGAEITAHENTRKHLSTTTRVEGWNFTFPPAAGRCFTDKAVRDRGNAPSQWRDARAQILSASPHGLRYIYRIH